MIPPTIYPEEGEVAPLRVAADPGGQECVKAAASMVERVARAICKTEGCTTDFDGCDLCKRNRSDSCLNTARAAIEAMREPTEEMRRGYRRALTDYIENLPEDERAKGGRFGYKVTVMTKAYVRWNAMIDAALAEDSVAKGSRPANSPLPEN